MARGRIEILSRHDVERIHGTSIMVLEKVGVMVHSPLVSEALMEAGGRKSGDGTRLLMPEGMVKEALRTAPKKMTLASRDGKNDLMIPSDRLYVANGGEGVYMKDMVTGETHPANSDDLRKFAILSEALPQADFFWPMVGAQEQPVELKGITEADVSLRHTRKHVQAMATNMQEARDMVDLAALLVGGKEELAKRPIISAVECPISPLTFEHGLVEGQFELSKWGIPVVAMSAAVAGLTSPVTIAGTTAQVNAENLASLVISQTANSGAPFIYSSDSCPGDLQGGSIDYSALEAPLMRAAFGQMGRSYGLPTMVTGIGTEGLSASLANAWEGVPHVALQTLIPSDLGSGFGGVDQAMGASTEQFVADAWIWDVARNIGRDFEFDDAAISFETIRDAGIDGNFLSKRHTVTRFRKEAVSTTMPAAAPATRAMEKERGALIRRAKLEADRILASGGQVVSKEEDAAMAELMGRIRGRYGR